MRFEVDATLQLPLPAQIAEQVRQAVLIGTLCPGDRVPSTRAVAKQTGVSRGTVVAAYDQLISEGYLLASQGAPTTIHPRLKLPQSANPSRENVTSTPKRSHAISLKPSSAVPDAIRPAAWRKAWREGAETLPSRADKLGEPQLRQAIADHLRIARGLAVNPEYVIVTGGAREGLLLTLMSLGTGLRVGVEKPGHAGLQAIIPLAGHQLVTCRTDESGIIPALLPDDLDVLIVTPSHLYPLGGTMPANRRAELLNWATIHNATIVEDDFSSELRYRIGPQPTLATLNAPAEVITLGTFATLLNKQLSAGYVVTTPRTHAKLASTREILGTPVSTVTQAAITFLLSNGYVRKNTKAIHNELQRRRTLVKNHLLPVLKRFHPKRLEMSALNGVDFIVEFPNREQLINFEEVLSDHNLICARIDNIWSGSSFGVILSFSHLNQQDFDVAVRNFMQLGNVELPQQPRACRDAQ